MKTSITKLKSSLFFSFAVLAMPVLAKPVAQVTEVKGQVFVITPEGKTNSVKVNDRLEENSEIMVGEDGDITLNDYYDATYHLIEGSHIKFFNKSVQLKQGKAWVQSLNSRHPLSLTTGNSSVDFWKGEFIATFVQANSKTQVLVVNGEVEVSNVLDKNTKQIVAAGHFTMLDPETEDGHPRTPTSVGLNSLNTALAEFKALPAKLKENSIAATPERGIASVKADPLAPSPKGEIIFMTDGKKAEPKRLPASVSGSAHKYFKAKVTSPKVVVSAAPIRFYGMSAPVVAIQQKDTPIVQIAPRLPASVAIAPVVQTPAKVGSDLSIDQEFSHSLSLEQASQPKHTKELESLIQDLKSY